MALTWRGHAARAHNYFDAGEGICQKAKNLLVIGAALKILGASLTTVIIATPFIGLAYVLVGIAWIRWGWYRQISETAVIDTWNPVTTYTLHALVRLLIAQGQSANGFDLRRIPPELQDTLLSTRKERCIECGAPADIRYQLRWCESCGKRDVPLAARFK
jgi:hypothetical protein